MVKQLYALLLPCIILVACHEAERKTGTEGNESLILKQVRYNHPDLIVDLGVGLWAWPLPMDFDSDGDMDLLVSCPDVPYKGMYFFENKEGKGEKMPVFEPPVKIGTGRNNLQVCYVDGQPRVLGRGVEYSNFKSSVYDNPVALFPEDSLAKEFTRIRFSQWKYADFENDGDLDLIVGMDDWGEYGWDNAFDDQGRWKNGPLHGYVFLLENADGNYIDRGKIMANGRPIDVYGAPSPSMMDFDGDGDLDIICGEFLDRLTWFENIGTREDPEYAEGKYLSNEEGVIKMDLEMITPSGVDWDADGDIDLVVGDEDGRVALLENSGEVNDHMPLFYSPVYFQQRADLVKFGALITPFATDWDADGDQDLICGNTAGYIGFIENMDGENPPKWNEPLYLEAGGEVIRIMAGDSGSIQGPAEKKWGYTTLSVADWDGDGLQDIIFNSIWGKVQWFKNEGPPGSPVLSKAQSIRVEFEGDPPKPAWNWWDPEGNHLVTQWRTTPFAIDWNHDGLTDLVMLDTEGYLSYYERIKENNALKLLPGRRIFYGEEDAVFNGRHRVVDSTGGPLRLNNGDAGGSGRRKFCIGDWDQDGDWDLLVNSESTSLLENIGTENGKVMFRNQGPITDVVLAGHTTSPTMVNWDGDNTPDLLIGAEDGHLYYYHREGTIR